MIANEQIQLIAEQLLPGFIPKDPLANTLTFFFTVPPANNFEVRFNKEKDGKWTFVEGRSAE